MIKNNKQQKRNKWIALTVFLIIVILISVGFFLGFFNKLTGNPIIGPPFKNLSTNFFMSRIASPNYYTSGVPMVINITVRLDPSNCAGTVIEYLPEGWSVSGISGEGGGTYNLLSNRIIWAPIYGPLCGGGSFYTLGYVATPDLSQSGSKLFNGVFSVDGKSSGMINSIQGGPSQIIPLSPNHLMLVG